jgi:hypothetical protein
VAHERRDSVTPEKVKAVVVEWWHVASVTLALMYMLWHEGVLPLVLEISRGFSEIAKTWHGA